jgi:hypothetical protein
VRLKGRFAASGVLLGLALLASGCGGSGATWTGRPPNLVGSGSLGDYHTMRQWARRLCANGGAPGMLEDLFPGEDTSDVRNFEVADALEKWVSENVAPESGIDLGWAARQGCLDGAVGEDNDPTAGASSPSVRTRRQARAQAARQVVIRSRWTQSEVVRFVDDFKSEYPLPSRTQAKCIALALERAAVSVPLAFSWIKAPPIVAGSRYQPTWQRAVDRCIS